jgi:glycine oxidase
MNKTSDVVIVGGGIIGCSIAWRLSQAGLQVTVVDAGKIGGESSWAGAGMLAPGGEVTGESDWARLSVESLKMYPGFCEELTADSGGIAIDFSITGSREYGDMPELQRRAAEQAKIGIPSRIEADHVVYPEDAQVNPRDVVAAAREASTRRGGRFIENAPVSTVTEGSVTAGGETISAGWVVLAAGAWSSRLLPEAPATFPVKGHLIGYWMEPGAIGPIYRNGHHYVLQRRSGYVIAGSTTEHAGFNRDLDPQAVKDLHIETRRVFPDLPEWPVDFWIGFRPGAHGDPVVHQHEDRKIWLAYGHYRNGILNAPMTARILTEAIAS